MMRTLLLGAALSTLLVGTARGEAMGSLEVFNGAEPAVSELDIARCDAPDARQNLLANGETIATGSGRTFEIAPGCWIVSLKDGLASSQINVVAGGVEHYTLMES